MNLLPLVERLKKSEGYRSLVYMDTKGNLTIGYGTNLGKLILPPGVSFKQIGIRQVNGVTPTIAEALLLNVLLPSVEDLREAIPWFDQLDEVRQRVLADMVYNLGTPGLLRWPIFLGQVQRGEYQAAARNMRSTAWARDVGERAIRLAYMMEHGEEPDK